MPCRFELAHLGFNLGSSEEANQTAHTLAVLFNLRIYQGKKSVFAGPCFECMKEPFLGTNGHIAMRTEDLDEAVRELTEKGFSFRDETASYEENGALSNIYLREEIGGFAIHIMKTK